MPHNRTQLLQDGEDGVGGLGADRGQPAMRTIPPLTTAAARNGTALDRSGSITQCRAAIGPGETRHRLVWVSSTSTPASRSIATVIATCGADGTDSPVCTIVSPSVNAAPDSSSPETNCDDADASISTVPPATEPPPRTENGRPSPSMSTPSPRNASSSGAIGRARACSSPSNTTVSVPSAATGGTNRSTVPARPQSTRASGDGCDLAADRQLGVVAVDGDAQGAQRADHQVGVAAAQRAADGRRPLRGGQRGEHERPVGLRLRAGHRHRGVHRARRRRCLPGSRLPSCPVALSATMGYMCGRFAVTTDPALLAEKIQAIDESDVGQEGLRRPELQRRTDHHDQHGGQTAQRARRRVDAAGAADALGAGAAVGQGGRGRRAGHQGPAADQRARGEGHQLARVPQFGEGQALPGADGRLVRVAPANARKKAPRRRSTCTAPTASRCSWRGCGRRGGPKGAPKDSAPLLSCHDHHHRRGRPARRDPRPDAADDQRERLGPLARPRRAHRRGAAARARRPRPDRDPRGVAAGEQRPQQRPRADRAGRAGDPNKPRCCRRHRRRAVTTT